MRLTDKPKPTKPGTLTLRAARQALDEGASGRLGMQEQDTLARALNHLMEKGVAVDDDLVVVLADLIRGIYERF